MKKILFVLGIVVASVAFGASDNKKKVLKDIDPATMKAVNDLSKFYGVTLDAHHGGKVDPTVTALPLSTVNQPTAREQSSGSPQ